MKTSFPALLLFLPAALQAAPNPALDAGPLQWKRTPELLVPFVRQAPSIDGQVGRLEWSAAAGLGPLKAGTAGVVDDLRREVRLCHDGTTIYLAFRLDRPKDTLQPAAPEGTGRVEGDLADAAEVLLAPGLNFNDVSDFWLHANGAFGDAKFAKTRERDTAWNAEWKSAARLTETGWEGEMAIPFTALGRAQAPAPEEWWGFDFADARRTPFPLAAHWSYRGRDWKAFENLGRVRFAAAEGPAVRLLRAGPTSDGRPGLEFEAVNPGAAEGKLNLAIQLLARRADTAKSYFENIDSGVSHDAQAEFTKDATLARMITFSENFYAPLPDLPGQRRELVLPAGQRRTFGLAGKLPVGEYLAAYRVEGAGGVLSTGTTVFRIETPLALRFEPYWLYSQVVDVFADLGKTGLQGAGELVLDLLPAQGEGAPLKSARTRVQAGNGEVKAPLPVGDLAPGFYRIRAVLLDGAGKELARNVQAIERPETPPWFKNQIGNQIEVPTPWTPLKLAAPGQVAMWGRRYDLTKVLPASVNSGGREILAAPVALDTQTATGPVTWKVEKLALKAQSPARAEYEVALSGGGLRIAGSLRVEFDGLIWYDLQVQGPGTIQSMVLRLPVRPEFAELMGRHKFLEDPVLGEKTPSPELNGAPGLLQEAKFPFTPYVWIGNEAGGLGFMAEAPIDWSINAPARVLETSPATSGRPAEIRVNLVQAPKTLAPGRPMRLQFGLQATPIRPAPENHGLLNIYQRNAAFDDEKDYANLAKFGCKVVVYYYDWRGNSETEMGGTPERPVDPAVREKLKRSVDLAHKHGMKVIMFTGWGINAVSPTWKKYPYELARYPITNGGWGTFNTSAGENGAYVDFMAWGHADIAREYGVDGVLWDSSANLSADSNERIGNAWVDDQGRSRPKYALLATRELYRRVYNIYKGEVAQDGLIYNHAGSLWPINVFADMQNRGEGRPMKAATLRESWIPFEEFRAEYSAEPFGTLYSGEINDWEKLPMRVSTHLAVTLLHGTYAKEISIPNTDKFRSYGYERRPVVALWETFNWLPMDGREQRHYYYGNRRAHYQAVKAAPASLLSSAFVSGDRKRAVIVVSNLDTTPIPGATVELDAAGLGLAPGALKVRDGVTSQALEPADGVLTLDIDQQRYRVLKVSVE